MHKEAIEELDVRFKLLVLDLAEHSGVTKTCREFDVPRSSTLRCHTVPGYSRFPVIQ